MKNSMVFEIIKKEIRDVIRDKKTLVMMIVVPILLYPIMFGFLMTMEDSMMNVEESQINKFGFAFEPDALFGTILDAAKIQKTVGTEEELKSKFENGELDAYITLEGKTFTICYTQKNTNGIMSMQLATSLIESYKQAVQAQIMTEHGLSPDEVFDVFTIEKKNLSEKDYFSEMMLGMIPTFILMTATLTAVFAAIDMTAGEKERGTLETLLTFPLKNGDIIYGKFFATSICTVISSVIGFVSMYGVLYVMSGKLESFREMELLTAKSFVLALILFVLYAMLISALAIMIASKAKSFKEAQNSTQPLAFVSLIPMFLTMMGTKLSASLAAVPFINVYLLLNDIISNTVDMQFFAIAAVSTVVFIFLVLMAVTKLYKSDKILFS